jgi:hypothetical protein
MADIIVRGVMIDGKAVLVCDNVSIQDGTV